MTLPEASACIDVHNGNPIGSGRATSRMEQRREGRQDGLLYEVCDRLHVAPAHLADVPLVRVLDALREMKQTHVEEAVVRATVRRFAADHAEPEASPLKPRKAR